MLFKSKSIFYFILYVIIFIVAPFLLLLFTTFLGDFSYYLKYFVLILPLSFLLYLVFNKLVFKEKFDEYKTFVKMYWLIFVCLYIVTLISLYLLIVLAFKNSNFLSF